MDKTQRRQNANARHIAPEGARSIAFARLYAATPKKYQQKFCAAVVNGEAYPERFLNHGKTQFLNGIETDVVAYAGGAIVNTLPRSKASKRLTATYL